MRQLNIRVPDELAHDLKRVAAEQGTSVNALMTAAGKALVDPENAPEGDRLRERLRRAGLLVELEPFDGPRPTAAEFEEARRTAGQGRPLSDYVSEGRGPR